MTLKIQNKHVNIGPKDKHIPDQALNVVPKVIDNGNKQCKTVINKVSILPVTSDGLQTNSTQHVDTDSIKNTRRLVTEAVRTFPFITTNDNGLHTALMVESCNTAKNKETQAAGIDESFRISTNTAKKQGNSSRRYR